MTQMVYLKSREYFIGVAPSEPHHVYADRTIANGWEKIEMTKLPNGFYSCRFVDANRLLSLQPDGRFETRDVGAVGPWEQIAGGVIQSGPQAGLRILGPFVVYDA